jgi:type IV pilus assembly protein PilE
MNSIKYSDTTKTTSGFSLLELLVALAIVGILATVAYPSYQDSVRKANRSEAIAELQAILAAQERFFLTNRTYTTNLQELGYPEDDDLDNYDLEAATCQDDGDDEANAVILCVEVTASADTDNQRVDGDIVMNSLGRSELVEAGTDTVKKQL